VELSGVEVDFGREEEGSDPRKGFGGICDLLGVWVSRGKEREERAEKRRARERKETGTHPNRDEGCSFSRRKKYVGSISRFGRYLKELEGASTQGQLVRAREE